ncbi:MAG TPA: EAL domain-containing protein, partial [Allocoleopsis sp.]
PDLIIPEQKILEDYQNQMGEVVKEKELKKALVEEELNIYYQPQIDIKTGRIISVEALLRWQHPEKGLVLPSEFIEIAKRTEIIIDMENWLLENACEQLGKWQKSGWENLGLSVNLSRGKFQHPQLIETIKQILENAGVKPQKLEVEVTEKILMHNVSKSIQILKQLKMLGINIAIDDFGTDCSSLLQLQKFPFTTVKIDRCLVENVQAHPINATIITAIIDMANQLNLRVIAEGTETLAELGLLKEKGCSIIQGYLFSYPVPAGELEQLLHQGKTLDYHYGRT